MNNNAAVKKTLLTEGPIWQRMTAFALPLFFGNLFQQLYNTADSLIVGNFLGDSALAAVSSSGSLIFLLVGFFNGISMGAGVVIARYFGADKKEELQKAIHTDVCFGLIAGILLTVLGMILTPKILVWMRTPEDVLPNSILYFRTYFMGSLAFVMYNTFIGILQSVGDSRHPLYYLIVSSIVNIVLDLVFVGIFHMGVGSAALATIISQFLSAGLCFYRLTKKSPDMYKVSLRKLCLDRFMLRQIISNGLPAGLQNSIISIANVVVQSNINSFGKMAMAGSGSYAKVEGFAFLPITCFSMSLTTFISQNLGAKKYDRAKKGARFGITCCLIMAELIGVVIFAFAPVFIRAFNSDPSVISFGVRHARTATLFYFLLAFSHCMAGILRGVGKAIIPMFVMLSCWCIIRVTYITLILKVIPDIGMIYWAYPITWTLSSIVFLFFYLKTDWVHRFSK